MIKRVLFIGIPVILLMASQAMATSGTTAFGTVTDINPSGKVGKIQRTDDGSNTSYVFLIPRGLADPDWVPSEGAHVYFHINPPKARVAHNVRFNTCRAEC